MPRSIPGAGEPTSYALPVPAPVGAVVTSFGADNSLRHYAVLREGLQPISPVVAAILRNTNSYRAEPAAPAWGRRHRPAAGGKRHRRRRLPERARHDRRRRRCAVDVRAVDTAGRRDRRHSPITHRRNTSGVRGASHGSPGRSGVGHHSRPRRADAGLRLPGADRRPGRRRVVDPAGRRSQFLAQRHRCAVRPGHRLDDQKTIAALGLTPPPLPIPWSMLSQFAEGPTLSRTDALLAHDGLAADPRPAVVRETQP